MSAAETIPDLFTAAAAAGTGPARPLLTWYDDSTGERTELSYATTQNWVAKTANLLIDQAGLWPGDLVSLDLPPHWLTAAIGLGAWTAGMAITEAAEPAPLAFVAADRLDGEIAAVAEVIHAVELAPLAVGLRPGSARDAAATGAIDDYLVEVRANGDHFSPVQPLTAVSTAMTGISHADLVRRARDRASDLGLTEGARVLLTAAGRPMLEWLLAPLAVAGSVVLVAGDGSGADLERRARDEQATMLT